MISHVLKLLAFDVVLARPTNSSSSEHEPKDETEEDSEPSSIEEGDKINVSSSKENSEDISDKETVSSHDLYSPLSPYATLENSSEDRHTEYSSPRPPDSRTHGQCGSNLHEGVEVPMGQFSALSLDRYPSEFNTHMGRQRMPLSRNLTSYSTLSADDLTLDARACARPRRRNKDTKTETKAVDKQKLYGNLKYKDKKEMNQREDTASEKDSIEDFIKQLVSSQRPTNPNVLFFDAAIVYEKEDYIEAMNFKEETLMIVKSDYNEEIRIELFDSAVFAQSKVCVVQDVVDKCSMIFVYLTDNFRSPELKFFVEEAIGICRLELGNKAIQSGFIHNDRQWIVKPVHTASPKMRAYKIPSGLLTVSGIDWYDKHSAHTQNQIRAVIRTAYNARKQKETEKYMSGLHTSQLHLIKQDPTSQTHSVPTGTASAKVLSNATDMGKRRQEHISSNPSMDALSLIQNMPQSGSLQNQQTVYSADKNTSGRMFHIPSVRADPNGLPQYVVGGQYVMSNPHNQIYPEVNANRSLPVNTVPHNLQQTGQYSNMGPYVDRYSNLPGYQHTNQQHEHLVQSASIQGRNTQHPFNGHVSNINAPIYPGYVQDPYVGVPLAGYHRQVHFGPGQGQSVMSMSSSSENRHANPQLYQRTNSGMHMHTQGNYSNNQVPLHQHNMNFHHPTRYHEDQAVSRDAYPREPGNFLLDQRNDTPPTSQLSVVSKVTGSLIVNPNLSTDDIEVDHGNPTPTCHKKSRSKNDRAKHKRRYQAYESTDSEESSCDSDWDFTKSWKEKLEKKKVVNVIGSKIVQIGRRNKVVERGKDNSQDLEKSAILQTKCEHIGMNPGTEFIGNCLSRVPDNKDSFAQVKDDINSTSEINALSTDNMSVERSLNSMSKNINRNVKEKVTCEKMTDIALVNEDHRIEGLELNASCTDNVNSSQMNVTSNDRNSRCYSQKFRSVLHQGSEVEGTSAVPLDDRLNENEDSLFESGSYNSRISNENNVTMARFAFSKAKEDSVGMLIGSSPFLKTMSEDMFYTNDTDDID